MKSILAALLLGVTPAAAQMSPVGCNAISTSAEDASSKIEDILAHMDGKAFRESMPYLPDAAKAPAADVEDARISAQMALAEYGRSLKAFAAKIKNCGG